MGLSLYTREAVVDFLATLNKSDLHGRSDGEGEEGEKGVGEMDTWQTIYRVCVRNYLS